MIVYMIDQTLLGRLFSSAANQMLIDAQASGLAQHRGSKGTVRAAQFIRNYLSKYLPRTAVAEHSGEIVATNAAVSGQCDVLILDPSTPPFWSEEHYRIVPAECVYGVIEVKSFLDAEELRTSWNRIKTIKEFPKTAYYPGPHGTTHSAYGREWPYMPTVGMIFAYDGAGMENLGGVMAELAAETPEERRIDSVWVLSKGFINWRSHWEGDLRTDTEIKTRLMAATSAPAQVLMALTFHLYGHFAHAWMPRLYISDYFPPGNLGTAVAFWEGKDRIT